jgi:hypothetical protein
VTMKQAGVNWEDISKEIGRNREACRFMWRRAQGDVKVLYRVKESPYPKYNNPLVMEGDALILGDVEAPFHHAQFVNRCLDLAQSWKVTNLILNGDFLHFDSISSWEPSWQSPTKAGLNEKQEDVLVTWLRGLPAKYQQSGSAILDTIARYEASPHNLSAEMSAARDVVRVINQVFERVDFVIGNHEGRLLRAMDTPLFPDDILRLIDAQTWRIAPYYYMRLVSGEVEYLIEHPKSAALGSASLLASKYLCNVIQGHSHLLNFAWDRSGSYYAITAGHCVDEVRLPYAAQRHTPGQAHALGAVIVRDGFPWLLHEGVDWERLAKL